MAAKNKQASANERYERFKELAREVEADESPDALDRSFARLDPRKTDPNRNKKKKKQRK
jgi:hypothetical protein